MNDSQALPIGTAKRWYGLHDAQHLAHDTDRMVDRCAQHLADTHGLSRADAEQTAMQVRASMDEAVDGFIDIDRSTSRMVVVNDTRLGTRHMISIARLLALTRGSPPAG